MSVLVIEIPGRELCPECNGDADGTPCPSCGGGGLLPFETPRCPRTLAISGMLCNAILDRDGWHHRAHAVGQNAAGEERLPRYRCVDRGHEVAIKFLPVPERSPA